MAKVVRVLPTVIIFKENLRMVNQQGMENFIGLMVPRIKASLLKE